jgi:hypothetical protein
MLPVKLIAVTRVNDSATLNFPVLNWAHFKLSLYFLVVGGGPDGCWDAHGGLPWWVSSPTSDNYI